MAVCGSRRYCWMDSRVLIFWEREFPFADTMEVDLQDIIDSLPPVDSVRSVGIADLKKYLKPGSVDLLINPYGSAFPKDAWLEIYEYLSAGGNLLNLGGAPFSVPVVGSENTWVKERRQTAYHRKLRITNITAVDTSSAKRFDTMPTEPLLSGLVDEFRCSKVFELQLRFTSKESIPEEIGTTGCREAVLRPLLYAFGPGGESDRIAAPVVAIDWIFGSFAGGRWILANFVPAGKLRKEILQRLATFALLGPTDFQVRPSFACYYPDERASFTIHVNRFSESKNGETPTVFLKVRKDNVTVTSQHIELKDFSVPYYRVVPLQIPLSPGVYTVEASLSPGDPKLTDKYATYYTTGFWCYDSAMVSMTQPLSAGQSYFMRDTKVSLLIGTTYMASDVHRTFLYEPNVGVWERDFAEIKAAGANVVRTGVWTGFRRIMLNPGAPDEGVIRAAIAFLLSAAKHDLTVIFTLFAFEPPKWEGDNPYLDPRCLQAQKEYVAVFARRLKDFNNLIWDLINEPAFAGQGTTWSCRPYGDEYEAKEWQAWVAQKHGADVSDVWHATPCEDKVVPKLSDFEEDQTYQDRMPLKAFEYRLFAQHVFNKWVKEIAGVIKQNGNSKQLVTVGQDEGGNSERPSPQFHWRDVDFTCTHTWWENDNLLWDGLLASIPGKPMLVEETGIMPLMDPDHMDRRSEDDYRNLLERKFVMAFASGGSGVIQWIWNSNIYMTTDCEVGIGLHRADLTRKPEFEVLPKMAAFIRELRRFMSDRQLEEVCMVIPSSNILGPRDLATEATKRCVRVMHYQLGVPMRAVGEYSLENLGTPKLIILPSPRCFSQDAWNKLIKVVESGAVLLVTGPIEWDEYWRPIDRLSTYGFSGETKPVSFAEEVIIFGEEYTLIFGGNKSARVDKAVVGKQSNFVKVQPVGSGKLLYAPLPFELADNTEPLVALYRFALRQALVESPYEVQERHPGILIRPLFFKEAIAYFIVSEVDSEKEFELTDKLTGRSLKVSLPAQRAVAFVLGKDGRVLAEYGGGVAVDSSE
jgi:hypothetical protein